MARATTKRRAAQLATAVALLIGLAAWQGERAARWFIALQTSSGDLSGIYACGALANQEGRPVNIRYGCMVPAPSHRQLEALSTRRGAGDWDLFTFDMGAQANDPDAPGYDPEASDDESPVRRVTLSPFWMTRYEITVKQFQDCVRLGPCSADDVGQGGFFNFDREGNGDHPINGVTWFGADTYCRWIGGSLPSEAQWEYVAKAGDLQRRFPWEGADTATCEHAVFAGDPSSPCGVFGTAYSGIHPRLADDQMMMALNLAGNVWEWTADWYAPDYGSPDAVTDPTGPPTGTGRVQRGGGYTEEDPMVFRAAFRAQMEPDMKLPDVGFRCVTREIDHPSQRAEISFQRVRDLNDWAGDLEGWRVSNGVLHPPEPGGRLRWREESFRDGELLSHLSLATGEAGLEYGQDERGDHRFRIRLRPGANTVELLKLQGAEETVLGAGVLTRPTMGNWRRIGVRVEDGIHRVTSQGEVAIVAFDNDWPGEGVGLYAGPSTDLQVSDILHSE